MADQTQSLHTDLRRAVSYLHVKIYHCVLGSCSRDMITIENSDKSDGTSQWKVDVLRTTFLSSALIGSSSLKHPAISPCDCKRTLQITYIRSPRCNLAQVSNKHNARTLIRRDMVEYEAGAPIPPHKRVLTPTPQSEL